MIRLTTSLTLCLTLLVAPLARAQDPAAPAPAPAAPTSPVPAPPAPGGAADNVPRRAPSPVGNALRRLRKAKPSTGEVVKPEAPRPAPPPPPPAVGAMGKPSTPTVTAPLSTGTAELPGEKEFNSCRKLPGSKRIVKLNMKPETELADLIVWISSITCTQFLVPNPSSLSGKKVTIISPELITAEEAYRLFLAAIESVGYTVEPTGKFLRIVETGKARFGALPLIQDGGRVPDTKGYVTRLVRLEYLDANEVATQVLSRVKGEQGDIIVYQNALIISDQGTAINRMLDILRQIDQPQVDGEKIWMLRAKNMSATDLATRLAEVFQVQYVGTGGRRTGQGGAPAPAPAPPKPATPPTGPRKRSDLQSQLQISKIIPDERSNHLLVIATEPAFDWLRTIAAKIDSPIEGGGDGRVNIYYCEHANCDELAATLGAITGVPVSGAGGARRRTSTTGAAPAAPTPTPTPGGPGQQNQVGLFEGDVRVTFDRPTNALVVVSSLKDYQSLRKVIEKLDSPRKQVFIEALVMEVNLDKSRELGVNYHGGWKQSVGGTDSLAIAGFGASKTLAPASLLANPAVQSGLTGALFGPVLDATTTRVFGTTVELPAFGVLVQALQSNNDVNVLSNPSLYVMNNEEGEITVGQNVPFPGGFLGGGLGGALGGQAGAAAGLGGFPFGTSVQRQDVALKMKLLPSVNEHNLIRLDVDVEISDILSPNFNNLGPATSKRSAKTPVFTRDQQTVIIGGLMTDRTSEVVTKVPILGDIPILGFFFRNTKKQIVKSNIIIALTPYVIEGPADTKRIVEKKMRERREFIERFTAFSDAASSKVNADTDYAHKRGMLEEINKEARDMAQEEASLQKIRERDLEEESVPIQPSKRKDDGDKNVPAPPGATPTTPPAGPTQTRETHSIPGAEFPGG